MDAVILAAGYGRGLEPLTHTRNKVLLPVVNTPLLEYQIKALKAVGVDRVVIVVNYLRDQVGKFLNGLNLDVDVKLVDQGKPLGTGHALMKALEYVTTERFLVLYGDVYVGVDDLKKISTLETPAVAGYEVKDPRLYGVLIVDSDGSLKNIIEKPASPPSNMVNAGIYLLTHDVLKHLSRIEVSSRGEYELTDALTNYAKETSVKVVRLSYWIDIGRPWKLLELNKKLMDTWNEPVIKGRVENGVVIKGNVIVEEDAEVLSGTYIVGPAYIGKGAVIGPNAYIRPYSVILDRSRIGFNVEIKESLVMSNTHIAHQAYVGDSIIGEHSNLGAGTILANLRFDNGTVYYRVKGKKEDTGRSKFGAVLGDYVKTGVNVSIMPGVKVGAYSWIYAGITVNEDIPPCTFYKGKENSTKIYGDCPVNLSLWST
ncbi:MAG: hypothetical protein B7O98_03435 [Zestosphaera tikiterensis]|uniref:Uncharacterized protein n=1 Tax=Zestosphaera tikiterensis TaxID=1973259 RepID=A0A2R7Y9E6_9CREN|nr:MAG: hypothetical protein B7O98_03435 [Zestosphaera tikiterensis]